MPFLKDENTPEKNKNILPHISVIFIIIVILYIYITSLFCFWPFDLFCNNIWRFLLRPLPTISTMRCYTACAESNSKSTFEQDCEDSNPLIRALAVRTMGCIRVDKITEYLCEPLRKCLKDEDPYVRKTAAVCVAKLYDISSSMVSLFLFRYICEY